MSRGGKRANSGRKRGSRNKRVRRMVAIDAFRLSELTRQYSEDAIKALVEIVRTSRSEAARVSAAVALLDRSYGKPKVQMDVSARSRVDVVYRSEAEFRQALIDRGLPERLLPPTLASDEMYLGDHSEDNDDGSP